MLLLARISWSQLDQHAGSLQAICAALGLVGLVWYSVLTHGIRKASIAQAKASLMPYLVIERFREEENMREEWVLRNLGNGPAVQIYWKPGSGNEKNTPDGKLWFRIGDLAAKDWSHLPYSTPHGANQVHLFELPEAGLRIHYGDLSQESYQVFAYFDGGVFRQECGPLTRKERLDLVKV